jgi:hypothetical protein
VHLVSVTQEAELRILIITDTTLRHGRKEGRKEEKKKGMGRGEEEKEMQQ